MERARVVASSEITIANDVGRMVQRAAQVTVEMARNKVAREGESQQEGIQTAGRRIEGCLDFVDKCVA